MTDKKPLHKRPNINPNYITEGLSKHSNTKEANTLGADSIEELPQEDGDSGVNEGGFNTNEGLEHLENAAKDLFKSELRKIQKGLKK